jgi:hypothetical protein
LLFDRSRHNRGMLVLSAAAETRRPDRSLEFTFSSPSCLSLYVVLRVTWDALSPLSRSIHGKEALSLPSPPARLKLPFQFASVFMQFSLGRLFSLAFMRLLSFPLGLPIYQLSGLVGRREQNHRHDMLSRHIHSTPFDRLGIVPHGSRKATPEYEKRPALRWPDVYKNDGYSPFLPTLVPPPTTGSSQHKLSSLNRTNQIQR